MPTEPNTRNPGVNEQLERLGPSRALGPARPLVRHQDGQLTAVQEPDDRILIDVRNRMVVSLALPTFDAPDARQELAGRQHHSTSGRQESEMPRGVHGRQVGDRGRDRGPPWGSGVRGGEPLVIAVDHHDRTGRAQTALGLSSDDGVQPRGWRVGRPLMKEFQLAGVRLPTTSRRVVELRAVTERPDVAAEDRRLETHSEVSLPAGEDAQGELEVAVAVTHERQERLVFCHSTSQ
jgi:hypothetical protein